MQMGLCIKKIFHKNFKERFKFMNDEKKVIAVVVTYNRKELLKKSITAIINQDYTNCDVLIIDNASTDGTKEYISDLLENNRVHYINTGLNLGGAGGFNYGLKEAYKMNCDYMWIMDDDCIPHFDSLKELMKFSNKLNNEFGFLSSKVLWKDGSLCTMNKQKRTKWKKVKKYDDIQKIQYASFVSLFIKSSIVKKYGLPYKEFFIWSDDWEYTRRISKYENCYYVPNSVVDHLCESNVGCNIVFDNSDRINRFKFSYRNDAVVYRQDGFDGWLYLKIRYLYTKIRIIIKANNKEKKLEILKSATKEGRSFHPQIEYPTDGTNK